DSGRYVRGLNSIFKWGTVASATRPITANADTTRLERRSIHREKRMAIAWPGECFAEDASGFERHRVRSASMNVISNATAAKIPQAIFKPNCVRLGTLSSESAPKLKPAVPPAASMTGAILFAEASTAP